MLIEPITKGGRLFSVEEITYAIKIVRQFSSFPQRELADTLCEHWSWFTATGSYKTHACLMLLRDLESKKLISLQPLVAYVKKQSSETQIVHVRTQNSPIACDLKTLGSVVLVLADDKKQRALFNEYLAEHHYLGYKKPFGAVLRYFIMNGAHILGCVLIASAAKAISARDRWIGWDKEHRVSNLPWVINNTRFLIFPWVNVPHLASHVLGKLVKQVRQDFLVNWNYAPLLLETFVDPAQYRGTCYKAANWIYLGETTGRGHYLSGQSYQTTPKMIFVYPLTQKTREHLSTSNLMNNLQGAHNDEA
jgi:hypothetical protein